MVGATAAAFTVSVTVALVTVPGEQLSRNSDQRDGDADGKRSSGGANHHYTASEPDGDGRSDRYLHGGGNRNGATELSMAEERGNGFWGDVFNLHHADYDEF